MVKFLDLKKQYLSIKDEVDQSISEVLESTAFVGGKYVQAFEKVFASYIGASHCIGVGNGTDALEIAIEALGLPKGSEIIVPANTFIATSEAVTRTGYKVVFCDCQPGTYTLSIDDLKQRITSNTSAIIAVHLYGHPCNMDALMAVANQHQLVVIEDCAQAHGSEYKGQKVGVFGAVATFSFYPGKNLGAYGDGGAIVTNDSGIAEQCQMISNHGRHSKFNHLFEGRNSRLDGIQAAILSVKLKHLDQWISARIACADYYLNALANCGDIVLPVRESYAKQAYHLFVIRSKNRDALRQFLTDKGIQTGIHYPISLPQLKAYDYLNQVDDTWFANQSDKELLSLPIGEHLTEQDLAAVVEGVMQFANEKVSVGV